MIEVFDILHYLRCCLNCGSLFPLPGNFLCRQCWTQASFDLSQGPVLRTGVGRKLEALALFNWHPQKNDALSAYLAALKYWRGEAQWDEIASQLIHLRTKKNQNWPAFDLVIPAASNRPLDHSWHLAKALAAKLQIPVLSMLQKESEGHHQRGMGKSQRQLLRVKRSEKFSQTDLSVRRVLWVDDVITTGATARASIGALSPMQSYEIWCVAQRALL